MTKPAVPCFESLRALQLFSVASVVRCLILSVSVAFLAFPALAQQTSRSSRATALGKRVKCMCGGCNDAAGSCYHSGGTFSGPCDTALAELKEIDQHIARGESDDQILKAFVAEYGPTVLIEPPKQGFNLAAWIMPIAAPLFALGLLYGILRRWRQPHPGTSGAPAVRVPADLLARVQRETGKEEV